MFAEIKSDFVVPDDDEIVVGIIHKGRTRQFEVVCQPVGTPLVAGQEADNFIGLCGDYDIAIEKVNRQWFVSQLFNMRQASPGWDIFVVATGDVLDKKTRLVLCAMPPGTTPSIRILGSM